MASNDFENRLFDHAHRLLKTHETLLRDTVRNRAFYEALAESVTGESIVLDIGAGTGLWAVAAAKLGAKRVTAIEHDPMLTRLIGELARENGVGDRIQVICGNSFQVELDRRFDIVISETIGYLGYDENLVEVMVDARRRFLKDGGTIIPETIALYAAPGYLQVRRDSVPVGIPLDFHFLNDLNLNSPRVLKDSSHFEIAGDPRPLVETDLYEVVESPSLKNLTAGWNFPDSSRQSLRVNSFAVWVECRLATGSILSTRETTSWFPTIYRIEPPAGRWSRIDFTLTLTDASNYWRAVFADGGCAESRDYSPEIAARKLLSGCGTVEASTGQDVMLRTAAAEDDEFLFGVYAGTRQAEIAMTGWPPAQAESFLRMQHNTRINAYKIQFPSAVYSIILLGDDPAGTLIVSRDQAATTLIDIAVASQFRRKGIATKIIELLQAESAGSGACLNLHVDRLNQAALNLYKRMGFKVVGETDLSLEMTWKS